MRGSPSKSPKRKMTKCQGHYNASQKECHNIGCNYVKTKSGGTYCRSPMKRRPSPKKSPKKKLTKCQGMYNASESECHSVGCKFVRTKSGGTYCRSPMKRKYKSPKKRKSLSKSPKKMVRKSPKKLSKCQGKNGASVGDCHRVGCNYVKPKVGLSYCRSPVIRKTKSPKHYAKKTKRSPSKSPKKIPKGYAKKTRRSPSRSSYRTMVAEIDD